MQYGILSNGVAVHCHELEAPELDIPEGNDPFIPTEYQSSTCQIPFGYGSALTALRLGEIKNIDAMILCVLQYRSNWTSGKTWYNSVRELSKFIGVSRRYIHDRLNVLIDEKWLSRFVNNQKGSRYQLTHHRCMSDETPKDKHGNPLMFAVPHGKGSVFERLFAGDICWKSALLWLFLKLYSDWKTGETQPITITTLCEWLGMGRETIIACLKSLRSAGLLKRVSQPHETGVYQLYPKPDSKPKPVYRRNQSDAPLHKKSMRIDGDYRVSLNERYRIHVVSGQIEKRERPGRGRWSVCNDDEIFNKMPKGIREDFEMIYWTKQSLLQSVNGSSDNGQGSSDSGQGGSDSGQRNLFGAYGSSVYRGS